MRIASLGLAALLLLAGCTGGQTKDPVEDADFSDFDLDPTATTGIIRGVVVDDAVRPLAGVTVTARGGEGAEKAATTTEEGAFGFAGLAPGTYFLTASKAGFRDTQQSVDVAAGVAEPPIVKVLLAADPTQQPYFETYTFEGYLECGVTTPPVGIAVCYAAGEYLNDNTQVTYPISNRPQWVQTEMVWESTQATGNELAVMYSYTADCGLYCDHEVDGTSPLLLQANQTAIDTIGLGNGTDLYIRVFNSDLDETDAGLDGVCTPVPDPVLGATLCLANGVGLTLEQKFNHYTHVFYGYQPPEDWRFTDDPQVPLPPAGR